MNEREYTAVCRNSLSPQGGQLDFPTWQSQGNKRAREKAARHLEVEALGAYITSAAFLQLQQVTGQGQAHQGEGELFYLEKKSGKVTL